MHDDQSGDPPPDSDSAFDSSDSSVYGQYFGTPAELQALMNRIVTDYQTALANYLVQRGATRTEADDVVQDLFVKQFEKRTIFARLHRWLYVDHTPQRAFSFLKACVLHHFIDLRRRQVRHEPLPEDVCDSSPNARNLDRFQLDPLDYAWAVSVLQVAIHDLKTELIGKPSTDNNADTYRLLYWQVFVERFISPSLKLIARGRKFTAAEIAARLGLTREQVLYLAKQVRERFAAHLRQALLDSSPDTDLKVLLHDLKTTLILGCASLPDLVADIPDVFAESTLDTANVFSLVSSADMPSDEVVDLLFDPDATPQKEEIQELWELLVRRKYQPNSGHPSTVSRSVPKSIYEIIFSDTPSLDDLEKIKLIAKENGLREHKVMQEVYHTLYALTIARAKNALGRTITTLAPQTRAFSLSRAVRNDWLPEPVSRELELAIRRFADTADQSSLAP
jgi:DNA-directed RNA polymerase specialized sigma24 family protein